jgi:hypothetical protein
MRLLRTVKTDKFHEIEVQKSFLWIKWRETYRMFGDLDCFRFKAPDNYSPLGIWASSDIMPFFRIKL